MWHLFPVMFFQLNLPADIETLAARYARRLRWYIKLPLFFVGSFYKFYG